MTDRTAAARALEFYFDPISPYAWLASKELPRLAAAGFAIDARPVLFAGLLDAHGQKGPAEIAAKRDYTFRDVLRLAAQRGLPVEGPPTHPFNPLRALRCCIAVDDCAARLRLAGALLDAAWQHGRDLNDTATLAATLADCGLDATAVLAATETPLIKARLVEATRQAVATGVFGVPSFRCEGELFWGCDRIDALLWRAAGHRIDETALARVLARGASARRPGG